MNIVPNRVFSSASIQTDSPPPTSLEVTLVNVISQPADNPHSNKSPVQLPSPVSADYGRDSHPDNLAQLEEDMDDVWFNFECISLHVKPIVFRYLESNAVSHRWTLVPLVVLNPLIFHPYLRRTRNQRRSLQKAINHRCQLHLVQNPMALYLVLPLMLLILPK
jgi:hypothetical protein